MAVSVYQQHIYFLREQMALHPEWRETYLQQIKVLQLNLVPGDIDYVPSTNGGQPITTQLPPPANLLGGDGADAVDSREKLEYLRPILEKAAKAANVPFDVLAALVMLEGQGHSVNELSNPTWMGVAQIGEVEVEEERKRHPGAIPDGAWYSPEVQIAAAAFRLADNYGNESSGSQWTGWDYAMARYNGGETGPAHLNRSDYIELFHKFLDQVKSGGPIDS